MKKSIIGLMVGASLAMLGAHVVHARGFGGAHGGGAAHEGGYHGGASHAGGYHGGGSRGGYSGGERRESGSSGAKGAAAGHAANERRSPQASGAEGAAAGAAHSNRNSPQYSGAEGAAAGAAHANRNSPQYSGAEGAAAGAAAANRNNPQFSGAEGAAAGAAVANRNSPEYSGAEGAAAGYAAANNQGPPVSSAFGAAAGYAADDYGAGPVAEAHVALPTDAGYGVPAAEADAAYASNHQTEAVDGNIAAARGASVRNSYRGYGMAGQQVHAARAGAWSPAGWTAGTAWTATAWPAVGTSLGLAANVLPMAYNYGTNITYRNNQVFYGNQPVATADQYFQQASALAQRSAAPNPQANDWMPLGVFALVQNDQAEPHYVIQLAVNKAGTIGGNYSDLITGTNVPIQGSVDKKTQRVAWTVGANKNTVGETGLYNLTRQEAPALIHIGKDKTQQWLLVRLKQQGQQPK